MFIFFITQFPLWKPLQLQDGKGRAMLDKKIPNIDGFPLGFFTNKYLTRWDMMAFNSIFECVSINQVRKCFVPSNIYTFDSDVQQWRSSTCLHRPGILLIHMATVSCTDQSCPPDDLMRAYVMVMRSDENRSQDGD